MTFSAVFRSTLALLALTVVTPGQQVKHLFVHVGLGPDFHQPVSGRLLIFVGPGKGAKSVDMNQMSPTEVYIAAKEVSRLAPGSITDVDLDDVVSPGPFSAAKAGDYQLQAVLDVAHNYNYLSRAPGDLESDVASIKGWQPGQTPDLSVTLTHAIPRPPEQAFNMPADAVQKVDFPSYMLSQFWGRDTHIRAWVVLPPGYASHPEARYPTVYYTHGFGGNLERLKQVADKVYKRMADKKQPEMIWVLLDESSNTGTHEFADSVNNGPWGSALTIELIPQLEVRFRMDGKEDGRFLQGHSSGGWATLWLQTTYPKVFGGTWSTSPDPSDFHDFCGIDLYAPHANVYHRTDGSAYPIIRDKGKVVATLEEFAKLEHVLGPYGGQFTSFDWVFSPRAGDGTPMPMFNRETGDVDPAVVAYWRDHYDISNLVAKRWIVIGHDLEDKIHVFVGTADTFYLDGAAHRLQAVLEGLHAKPHFTFVPDRTHFDLYNIGEDRDGLLDQIAAEIYAVARPRK